MKNLHFFSTLLLDHLFISFSYFLKIAKWQHSANYFQTSEKGTYLKIAKLFDNIHVLVSIQIT